MPKPGQSDQRERRPGSSITAPSATILLIAAARSEIDATIRRLGLAWHGDQATGSINDSEIIAALTGIGARRAVDRVNALLDAHPVERVIHLGFAGGLDPALRPGDVLRIGCVCNEQGETQTLDGDPAARLLTADHLATTVAGKRTLHEATGAAAVDMETYPLAKMLHERGVSLIALRAISDTADTPLPRTALQWLDPHGNARPLRVAGWLLAHPGECAALWRLARHVRRAADRLAMEVERLVASGPSLRSGPA
ncbi:MAG: hypothetical protein ACODAQ_00475 [Phycisphaeraceae bacterium]